MGVVGDQSGGFQVGKALPRGMCALDLTDGVRKIRAVAMEPIPEIAMEMKLGAKVTRINFEPKYVCGGKYVMIIHADTINILSF